jgi:hypothetical protein
MDLSKSPNFVPNKPSAATKAVLDRLLPRGYTGPGLYTRQGHQLVLDDRCDHNVTQYSPMITDLIAKPGAVTEIKYRVSCGGCNQYFEGGILTTAGYGEAMTFNVSVTRPEPPNSKTLVIEIFSLDAWGRGHSIYQDHVLISGRDWQECVSSV